MNQGKILLFARAPEPGKAKTRLIPALGAEGAAALHARLVKQTLSTVCALHENLVELWCSPDTEHDFFQSCAGEFDIRLRLQRGEDLGARMLWAFECTLTSAPWAVLIGTDCPDLNTDDLRQAIAHLENGADAVAGPAHDGGYYLLGLRKAEPELFKRIPWGTDKVWLLTKKQIEHMGWICTVIRTHHDLDRPEDLLQFPRLHVTA